MECSTLMKVLRLAPDSVFVSFPRPFVYFLFLFLAVQDFVPSPSPFFFFFSQALRGLHVQYSHIPDALPALIIPGGFSTKKII